MPKPIPGYDAWKCQSPYETPSPSVNLSMEEYMDWQDNHKAHDPDCDCETCDEARGVPMFFEDDGAHEMSDCELDDAYQAHLERIEDKRDEAREREPSDARLAALRRKYPGELDEDGAVVDPGAYGYQGEP